MSGVISVADEQEPWVVAGWAFRGYLNQVLAELREDSSLAHTVEVAMDIGILDFPLTDPAVVRRLVPVLLKIADDVVSGTRPVYANGRLLDDDSQKQFRRAVAELRAILPSK